MLDLSENAAFLRNLLDDPLAWRHRLVERFSFGSGDHVRVESAYQCEFPPELLDAFTPVLRRRPRADVVNVLVPLATRPKQVMFAFDVRGPGGQAAHLLRREDIAALQRGYVRELVASSPAAAKLEEGLSDDLLEAICRFTPGRFVRLQDESERSREMALTAYLQQGLGITVSARTMRGWVKACDEAGGILAATLDEPGASTSSSECPLLALPGMYQPPTSEREISELLRDYVAAIRAAADFADTRVLEPIAQYGRRYELIVEVEVPADRPWTATIAENRPLRWRAGASRQGISLGCARSVHFEIDVHDPSVSLKKDSYELTTPHGEPAHQWLLEAVRDTDETLSLYTSEAPRTPAVATLAVSFSRPRYVRLTAAIVIGLTVVAAAMAIVVDCDSLVEKLTLFTVPTTFAAALLLVREQTALGAKLDACRRGTLAVATVVLWAIVVARMLADGVWFG